MWFLYQLQELYIISDAAATIGHDLTESETRRNALRNYQSRFLIYPFYSCKRSHKSNCCLTVGMKSLSYLIITLIAF